MTKSERSPQPEIRTKRLLPVAFDIRNSDLIRHPDFFRHSELVIRHSHTPMPSASVSTATAVKPGILQQMAEGEFEVGHRRKCIHRTLNIEH